MPARDKATGPAAGAPLISCSPTACAAFGQAMGVRFEHLPCCAAATGSQPGILDKVAGLGELAGYRARPPRLGDALALRNG